MGGRIGLADTPRRKRGITTAAIDKSVERYRARRAAGKCFRCNRSSGGFYLCKFHRERKRLQQLEHARKRIKLGLCPYCRRRSDRPGQWGCKRCYRRIRGY